MVLTRRSFFSCLIPPNVLTKSTLSDSREQKILEIHITGANKEKVKRKRTDDCMYLYVWVLEP